MSSCRVYARSHAKFLEHAFRNRFRKSKCKFLPQKIFKSFKVIFSLFRLSITGSFEWIKRVNSLALISVAFALSFSMAIPRLSAAMIKTPFNCPDITGFGRQCDNVWSSFSEQDCYVIFQQKNLTEKKELEEICNIKKSYKNEACDKPYISFIMSPNEDLSFSEIFSDRKIAFYMFQIIFCRVFPFGIIGNAKLSCLTSVLIQL